MERIKVLNLYACLGGNRREWIDPRLDITAVELDPHLAEIYAQLYPNDRIVVGDAHKYLEENFYKFDFIWSSPPCPSHSRARYWGTKNAHKSDKKNPARPVMPRMELYSEIVFLQNYFDGLFCVENVDPYYDPLIKAQKIGRHLYWSNFKIPKLKTKLDPCSQRGKNELQNLCEYNKIPLDLLKSYKGKQPRLKIVRNLVHFSDGSAILDAALREMGKKAAAAAAIGENLKLWD